MYDPTLVPEKQINLNITLCYFLIAVYFFETDVQSLDIISQRLFILKYLRRGEFFTPVQFSEYTFSDEVHAFIWYTRLFQIYNS